MHGHVKQAAYQHVRIVYPVHTLPVVMEHELHLIAYNRIYVACSLYPIDQIVDPASLLVLIHVSRHCVFLPVPRQVLLDHPVKFLEVSVRDFPTSAGVLIRIHLGLQDQIASIVLEHVLGQHRTASHTVRSQADSDSLSLVVHHVTLVLVFTDLADTFLDLRYLCHQIGFYRTSDLMSYDLTALSNFPVLQVGAEKVSDSIHVFCRCFAGVSTDSEVEMTESEI